MGYLVRLGEPHSGWPRWNLSCSEQVQRLRAGSRNHLVEQLSHFGWRSQLDWLPHLDSRSRLDFPRRLGSPSRFDSPSQIGRSFCPLGRCLVDQPVHSDRFGVRRRVHPCRRQRRNFHRFVERDQCWKGQMQILNRVMRISYFTYRHEPS